MIGQKAATNEVISKLVNALGDESGDVRWYACKALGEMGEKAATNEVITKLLSALDDKSACVRMHACDFLGKMGEKAATNEVISKLVLVMNNDSNRVCSYAARAVKNILNSLAVLKQLTPKIVAGLFLCRYASECLENFSEDELINADLTAGKFDWLPAVTQLSLLNGTAVTATENKVMLYGKREPTELIIRNLVLRELVIGAFIVKGERLYSSRKISLEAVQTVLLPGIMRFFLFFILEVIFNDLLAYFSLKSSFLTSTLLFIFYSFSLVYIPTCSVQRGLILYYTFMDTYASFISFFLFLMLVCVAVICIYV
jgi:hypothetical protein